MFRQVRLFAVVVLAVASAVSAITPAVAQQQDAPPAAPSSAKNDGSHPDAKRINQSNARVVHAGPGAPMRGSVHVAPAQAKRDARK
jgi:hypothetical protein